MLPASLSFAAKSDPSGAVACLVIADEVIIRRCCVELTKWNALIEMRFNYCADLPVNSINIHRFDLFVDVETAASDFIAICIFDILGP
jgi:hypothetical protein